MSKFTKRFLSFFNFVLTYVYVSSLLHSSEDTYSTSPRSWDTQ